MIIEPIITEKTLELAKRNVYTFKVKFSMNKHQIKKVIEDAFGVNVTRVRTINMKKVSKKDYRGKTKTSKAYKKAMVNLKEKEKIDLFDTKSTK